MSPYNQRPSGTREAKKIFLLAFEGAQTERTYFEGIKKNTHFLNINNLVEIEHFKKKDQHHSNPLSIIKELKDNITQRISRGDFNKDYDVVCLIVDRDPQSFTAKQFDQVLKISEKENYTLWISNPCFELWLLFHFLNYNLDVDNFDNTILNDTLVQELKNRKYCHPDTKTFKKNRLIFAHYKNDIQKAITNAKLYVTDNQQLKNYVGSNVFSIIEQMQHTKK